jgi:tripartite-type tricarboxylate transporter receptor subunit TctC
VLPSLFKKLPYDTVKDLTPVTMVASAPLMLVVNPSVPAKSVAEFIAYAKANPGKLNFGSGGTGATPHLAGEMLKFMAGLQVTHIPYKGGAPALADLIGGQIQFMCENIPGTLPFVKAGKLRALAVTDLKRSPLLPELPTLDESGLKGYQIVGWNGLFVPTGTPPAIVTQVHAAVSRALALAEVKERLAVLGADGVGDTPLQFGAFIKADIAKWAQVVRNAGLKAE